MNSKQQVKRIGIDIGSFTIKVSHETEARIVEEIVWEGGDREIQNIVAFGNTRKVGRVLNTKEEHLPQIIQGVNNFVANNMNQTFQEALWFNFCRIYKTEKELVFEILYKGKKIFLKPSQIIAAIFSFIKQNLKLPAQHLEFSLQIPDFFSEAEKQTITQALEIAQIQNYHLVQQSTCLLSQFLYTRKELSGGFLDKKRLVFIDIGHSSVGVFFVQIQNQEVNVVHRAVETDIGVASLDRVLENYIINDIWKKYRINITQNRRLLYRLSEEIQKKRRILSSNMISEIELDAFPRDNQFYGLKLTRDSFANLNSDVSTKFENFLIREIQIAEEKKFELGNIEIQRVGGGSRIPLFKDCIMKVFNRDSFANINGNSYMAEGALLYPYLKENYNLIEKTYNQYVIELTQIESGEVIEAVLFEKET